MPRLGEAPHGKFYVTHGGLRIWATLIMRIAIEVNDRQVREDPTVQFFNAHEHFLRTITRAPSEYVREISRTSETTYAISSSVRLMPTRRLLASSNSSTFSLS